MYGALIFVVIVCGESKRHCSQYVASNYGKVREKRRVKERGERGLGGGGGTTDRDSDKVRYTKLTGRQTNRQRDT